MNKDDKTFVSAAVYGELVKEGSQIKAQIAKNIERARTTLEDSNTTINDSVTIIKELKEEIEMLEDKIEVTKTSISTLNRSFKWHMSEVIRISRAFRKGKVDEIPLYEYTRNEKKVQTSPNPNHMIGNMTPENYEKTTTNTVKNGALVKKTLEEKKAQLLLLQQQLAAKKQAKKKTEDGIVTAWIDFTSSVDELSVQKSTRRYNARKEKVLTRRFDRKKSINKDGFYKPANIYFLEKTN